MLMQWKQRKGPLPVLNFCVQVQRLREHIEKKHAGLADADGSATATASADTEGAAESSAQQPLQASSKASQL